MAQHVRLISSKFVLLPVVLAGVFSTFGAHAATYSNSYSSDIYHFGSPDTTSYGQVFSLGSASQLNSWSFFASSGNAGQLGLVVADWDGDKAVGPVWASSTISYAGGAQTLDFNGINLNLSAGTYIAYITTAGFGSPASTVYIAGSDSDGGLAGGFT